MTDIVAILQSSTAVAVPMSAVADVGPKGDPGGNVMAIGLFVDGSSLAIPAGTEAVRTSGHTALGKGIADYVEDAAVDAGYVAAHPNSSFISANGRGFRLSTDQMVNIQMFGAIPDDTSLAAPSVIEALAWCAENGTTGYGEGDAALALYVPPGVYWMDAETIDFTVSIRLYGEGFGGAGGGASVLRWGPNTTGFRFQRHDTFGDTGVLDPGDVVSTGANGSIIHGLTLYGAYSSTEGEYHAIHIRAHGITVEQCFIRNWEGDGIFANAEVGGVGGNTNCFMFSRNLVFGCRDGIHVKGANAQAGSGRDNDTSQNRRWGIHDESFLGNVWHGISEGCGISAGAYTPSVVTYDGNHYAVVAGQEAGASTHAPSGDTTDNQWWYYVGSGGVEPSLNIGTWTHGATVRAGGPIRTTNHNARTVILGYYCEPGQGPCQLVWPTLAIGGTLLSGVKGVSWLYHSDLGIVANTIHAPEQMIVGHTAGWPEGKDTSLFFDNTGSLFAQQARHWEYDGGWTSTSGGGDLYKKDYAREIYGNPKIQFFNGPVFGGTFVGEFDTTDGMFNVPVGMKVAGTQVINHRHTAIPDITDLEPDTQNGWINAILGVLRHHGLIGT